MTALVDQFRSAGLLLSNRPDGTFRAICPCCDQSTIAGTASHDGDLSAMACEHGCDPAAVLEQVDRIAADRAARALLAAPAVPYTPPAAATSRAPLSGGAFVLDVPEDVPAVWGSGDDVLWASGEPLMICGPQGVGKTTLAQQLALARAGVLEPELLGFPVAVDDRPVLYVAADRPAQAARSMRRMVTEADRPRLDERLIAWRGPLPFTVTDEPRLLAEWVNGLGAGSLFIDSVKDLAVGLTDDAVGAAVNMALQELVASGVEVVDLHHQRKGQEGRKPRSLEDVYGSTWLTAGHGSIVLVWGDPGDPYVSLTHLKQPAGEVGPLDVQHDHARGRSSLPGAVDLLDLAARGVTAREAAEAIYDTGTPNRNQVERARRRLEKLADRGQVTPKRGTVKSDPVTYWLAVVAHASVTPREGSRDPLTHPVTQGHDLALEGVTHPLTQGHADTAPPFKGAETVSVTPGRDPDADRAERLAAEHADLNGGHS